MGDGGEPDDSDPVWARLIGQLQWYSHKSGIAQRNYKRVKVVQIVIGATVPVSALIAPGPVTATIAPVVVVTESLQQLFHWHTDWLLFRATTENLKHEKFQYLARIGPYRGSNRRTVLAERVEDILSIEHTKWSGSHTPRSETYPRE